MQGHLLKFITSGSIMTGQSLCYLSNHFSTRSEGRDHPFFTWLSACTYICTYVLRCVCTYVCTYVCMYVLAYGGTRPHLGHRRAYNATLLGPSATPPRLAYIFLIPQTGWMFHHPSFIEGWGFHHPRWMFHHPSFTEGWGFHHHPRWMSPPSFTEGWAFHHPRSMFHHTSFTEGWGFFFEGR